jgi:hypothetical protein
MATFTKTKVKIVNDILRIGGDAFIVSVTEQFKKYDLIVTGRTLRSIAYKTEGNKLIVEGADHIQTVQDGRPPTVNDGDGELIRAIQEWVQNRGLDLNPYAITKTIHKEGTQLWRGDDSRFKRPTDVLEKPSQDAIKAIQEESGKLYALNIKTTFVNFLKEKF